MTVLSHGTFNVAQKREDEAAPPAEPFKLKKFKNVPSRVLSQVMTSPCPSRGDTFQGRREGETVVGTAKTNAHGLI